MNLIKSINKKYDFIIVGSGLYGATCARLLTDKGNKVLVIEKNNFVGGNIYTETKEDIIIHVYGAHIFHTSDKEVWDFVNKHCIMNPFINSPVANYKGELYHLPFSMNTFKELWGVSTPEEAKRIIDEQVKKENIVNPKNLEEQALSIVGRDVFTKLIKDYTEKQWGRDCKDLPASIIKRLPVRFEFNNNYFNDTYQGIPKYGYTDLIINLLKDIDVIINYDYFNHKDDVNNNCNKLIYTGPIDQFYDYKFGHLEYRSLIFKTKRLNINSYQGMPVMNFTSHNEKYTRIIEHKFFDKDCKNNYSTYVTEEYPADFKLTGVPYYPINNDINNNIYKQYEDYSKQFSNIYFGGRLGKYKYFDMDDAIRSAIDLVNNI